MTRPPRRHVDFYLTVEARIDGQPVGEIGPVTWSDTQQLNTVPVENARLVQTLCWDLIHRLERQGVTRAPKRRRFAL